MIVRSMLSLPASDLGQSRVALPSGTAAPAALWVRGAVNAHERRAYERQSLIFTTNLPFSEWVSVLGDERLTSGLLDRLTFRSHILEFVGDSYRLNQQLQRQQHPFSESQQSPSFDSPKEAKARLPNQE